MYVLFPLKLTELFLCMGLPESLAWDSVKECVWSVTLLDSISQMVKQSKHTEGQGILRPRPHGAMRTDTRPWCMTGERTFCLWSTEVRGQPLPSLPYFFARLWLSALDSLHPLFSLGDIFFCFSLLSKEKKLLERKLPGACSLLSWHVWEDAGSSFFFFFSMWDLLLVQAVREAPSGFQADSDCCEITRQMSQSQQALPSRGAAWPLICRDRLDSGASGQYTSTLSSWTGSS